MSCDIGKSREGLETELWRRWSDGKLGEWALLYISISMSSAHSQSFPSLYLHHSSFSNPSLALSTSQDFHLCHLASRPCHTSNSSWLVNGIFRKQHGENFITQTWLLLWLNRRVWKMNRFQMLYSTVWSTTKLSIFF